VCIIFCLLDLQIHQQYGKKCDIFNTAGTSKYRELINNWYSGSDTFDRIYTQKKITGKKFASNSQKSTNRGKKSSCLSAWIWALWCFSSKVKVKHFLKLWIIEWFNIFQNYIEMSYEGNTSGTLRRPSEKQNKSMQV
jgi:hypothetical protein